MYTIYISPHFKYACEVWGGCTNEDSDKLECLQLQAARRHLYFETGWESLKERRRKRKLSQFYKIYNGLAPTCLSEKLPANVNSKSNYNMRNAGNIIVPFTRTTLAYMSFIPSTSRLWNELSNEIRQCDTVSSFKSSIRNRDVIAPDYYSYGARKYCILLTKLRYSVSPLNNDLFKIGLSDIASCLCGNPCENAVHYLLECQKYSTCREDMLGNIQRITLQYNVHINVKPLLNGCSDLHVSENETILKLVQLYIKQTKRFT